MELMKPVDMPENEEWMVEEAETLLLCEEGGGGGGGEGAARGGNIWLIVVSKCSTNSVNKINIYRIESLCSGPVASHCVLCQ